MSLQITMHIYSGRPDPQWTINGADEREVRRLLASYIPVPMVPYHMGYNGFTVTDLDDPQRLSIHVQHAPEIEQFLLGAGRGKTDPETGAPFSFRPGIVIHDFPVEPRLAVPHAACPPSLAADAPTWNPNDARWSGIYVNINNCYSYATNLNKTTGVAPQPGRQTGRRPRIQSGAGYLAGALSDGLLLGNGPSQALAAGQGHHVCLAINPGQDHHWYRQDADGCWSHKVGNLPITNLDASGQEIADPRFCNRGPFSVFVAWMIVPPIAQIS